uniref:Putative capsid protein n=1 Tax=viral metagenome TaxID=1070528 RepID=A0A6H1ZKN5_9ZZZZ
MAITEELARWNKYKGDILDRSKALGSAALQTVNRYGARPFIGGFNTAITEYGDGLPAFSTAHTRPDGGTNESNASNAGITLTEANLETALIAMRQQKSGTGKILGIGYNENLVLMVPNALDKEAKIITGSTKRSGTSNNDLNIIGSLYCKIVKKLLKLRENLIKTIRSQAQKWEGSETIIGAPISIG